MSKNSKNQIIRIFGKVLGLATDIHQKIKAIENSVEDIAKKDFNYTQKIYELFKKYIYKNDFTLERFTYNFQALNA